MTAGSLHLDCLIQPNVANNDGVRISEDRVMDRPIVTQTIFPDKLIKKRNSISKCF